MALLSADDLSRYRHREARSEVLRIAELAGEIRIEGVVGKCGREAIFAEIARFEEALARHALTVKHPRSGASYVPDLDDVTAAAWISACVTQPRLTAYQWLQFAAEGHDLLGQILTRCYANSGIVREHIPDVACLSPDGHVFACED